MASRGVVSTRIGGLAMAAGKGIDFVDELASHGFAVERGQLSDVEHTHETNSCAMAHARCRARGRLYEPPPRLRGEFT